MRIRIVLLWCLLLAGCAQAPLTALPEPLLHDHLFAAPSQPARADDVFAMSDAMRLYLRHEIAPRFGSKGRQRALVDALVRPGQLKLEYDGGRTRNAAEAFDARAGNCLSLVLMTAAFAKEIGLRIEYQSAFLEEMWSRSGDLVLRSAHVNVTVGARPMDFRSGVDERSVTIDFLPPDDLRGLRTRTLSERTVVAMYMNNRAAEALVQNRLDDAYAWASQAVKQDAAFLAAYNTLGVVYLRHRNPVEAERVFTAVLAQEPANTRAMHNLSQSLAQQGRLAEAAELNRRLAQIEPHPPFHFFELGLQAMAHNDFKAARDWFGKEVARADYYHEFHYWLALANFRLGDVKRANQHLERAMENSTTRRDHDLYAAKLAWLRAH
ncbi:tetratricopeptide repeat protein [Piscinibacter sp. XHJ-5]|uniref:tetratricopeptide repeat protein n=1 Tax=Piscinibacter sp. XHJ-5 TaxID=3037797 RepID=UPI002452B53B|nr:tetratricopeptide repeat protein [Piscinibacter sp. XHJ-5]